MRNLLPTSALFAALLGAAVTATAPDAEADRLEATVRIKNAGYDGSMRCTLYHVAHWSDRRMRAIDHMSVSSDDRNEWKTFRVTLPNRPIPKSRKVRTMPSSKYRPKLRLYCRYGSNKNHWKWGPMWETKDKPVRRFAQEAFCRDGSPCGISFEELSDL